MYMYISLYAWTKTEIQ